MKPIIFNTEMVRAILDGRKTVTRRVVKPQPGRVYTGGNVELRRHTDGPHKGEWHCYRESPPLDKWTKRPWGGQIKPPYQVGDVLYVRETWKSATGDYSYGGYGLFDTYVYKADGKAKEDYPVYSLMVEERWRPSIHMPKEAARIFLRVTDIRAERLQSIDEDGAIAEGCVPVVCPDCYGCGGRCPSCNGTGAIEPAMLDFVDTWNSTLKKKDLPLYGWEADPWVWVIEFERVEENDVEAH